MFTVTGEEIDPLSDTTNLISYTDDSPTPVFSRDQILVFTVRSPEIFREDSTEGESEIRETITEAPICQATFVPC